jgi:hypothetical protein
LKFSLLINFIVVPHTIEKAKAKAKAEAKAKAKAEED